MEEENVNNDEELESRKNEIINRAHRWINELSESMKTLVDEVSKSKIAIDHLDSHAMCIKAIFENGEPKDGFSLTCVRFMNLIVQEICKGKAKLVWDTDE
jgi:hypothetical protein